MSRTLQRSERANHGRGWARRPVVALLLAGALIGGLSVAGASANHRSTETLRGSCDFSGTVSFDPPLTAATRPTHAVADLVGTCTGTFTNARGRTQQLDGAPFAYHAESDGEQSCASSNASGTGYFKFRRSKLHFELFEERAGAVARLQLEGRDGGSFAGTASSSGDPVEIAMACAGPGLAQAGVTISGSTTPTISG
jgi:hypothetical protein